MKFSFIYPSLVYTNRDPEVFDDITMFNLSFPTSAHYFHNHDTGYEEFLLCLLGFGIRISREVK